MRILKVDRDEVTKRDRQPSSAVGSPGADLGDHVPINSIMPDCGLGHTARMHREDWVQRLGAAQNQESSNSDVREGMTKPRHEGKLLQFVEIEKPVWRCYSTTDLFQAERI